MTDRLDDEMDQQLIKTEKTNNQFWLRHFQVA